MTLVAYFGVRESGILNFNGLFTFGRFTLDDFKNGFKRDSTKAMQ